MNLLQMLKRRLYERRDYLFYTWEGPRPRWPEVPAGLQLQHFTTAAAVPKHLRATVGLGGAGSLMQWRMKRGLASLLLLHDGKTSLAWGWIQAWQPFARKFGNLFPPSTAMLGPYVTVPSHRGKGYYGMLLRASLAMAPSGTAIAIYTHPSNQASARGIEKEGFKRLGVYQVHGWLGLIYRLRAVPQEQA